MTLYEQKHFDMTVTEHSDNITVRKSSGNDWCQVIMVTNGDINGVITIRSKEMVESLYFMLGQILKA